MSELDARMRQGECFAALLETLRGTYAFTESDETSVLLARSTDQLDLEVEQRVSIAAARSAATFSLACGEAVEFDARIWAGARDEDVVDSFQWRQADAARCALDGWCHCTLRDAGADVRTAAERLEGASVAAKNELLFAYGINFNEVPAWQRRGTGLYWEAYEKQGLNPKTGERVTALRRRIAVDENLPMKADYAALIRRSVAEGS